MGDLDPVASECGHFIENLLETLIADRIHRDGCECLRDRHTISSTMQKLDDVPLLSTRPRIVRRRILQTSEILVSGYS